MLFQASPWLRRSWQARRKPRRYKTAKHTVFGILRKAASATLAPLLGCQRAHGRAPAPRPSEGFGGKDRKLCVVRRLPNQAGLFARKLVRESGAPIRRDRKSTRLNSSHRCISYAVFCLKKKKKKRYMHLDLIHVSQQ